MPGDLATGIVNMTSLYEMETWVDIFTWANTATNQLFISMMLFSIFLISYTYMSKYKPEVAFVGSMTSTIMIGSIFYLAGMLNPAILISMVLLTAGAVGVSRISG